MYFLAVLRAKQFSFIITFCPLSSCAAVVLYARGCYTERPQPKLSRLYVGQVVISDLGYFYAVFTKFTNQNYTNIELEGIISSIQFFIWQFFLLCQKIFTMFNASVFISAVVCIQTCHPYMPSVDSIHISQSHKSLNHFAVSLYSTAISCKRYHP